VEAFETKAKMSLPLLLKAANLVNKISSFNITVSFDEPTTISKRDLISNFRDNESVKTVCICKITFVNNKLYQKERN
jgi:hypothetical protein